MWGIFQELDITYRNTTLFSVILDEVRIFRFSDVFVVKMTCHIKLKINFSLWLRNN